VPVVFESIAGGDSTATMISTIRRKVSGRNVQLELPAPVLALDGCPPSSGCVDGVELSRTGTTWGNVIVYGGWRPRAQGDMARSPSLLEPVRSGH
jgi:hypothetical protein